MSVKINNGQGKVGIHTLSWKELLTMYTSNNTPKKDKQKINNVMFKNFPEGYKEN